MASTPPKRVAISLVATLKGWSGQSRGVPGVASPIFEWKSAMYVELPKSTKVPAAITYFQRGWVVAFPTARVKRTMKPGRKCSCSVGAGR